MTLFSGKNFFGLLFIGSLFDAMAVEEVPEPVGGGIPIPIYRHLFLQELEFEEDEAVAISMLELMDEVY